MANAVVETLSQICVRSRMRVSKGVFKMMEYIKNTLILLAVFTAIGLFTTFVESI